MNITAIKPSEIPSVPLSARKELPECPAIYLVLDGSTVLYVGKSVNLAQRWLKHHRFEQVEKQAECPRIAYVECSDVTLLEDLEQAAIEHFQPLLNGQVIPPSLRADGLKRITVYLPQTVKDKFEVLAERNERSASAYALHLIEKAIIGKLSRMVSCATKNSVSRETAIDILSGPA